MLFRSWGQLDYLIVDCPPGTGDAALTLTQQAPLSGAVIVTTANDLSLIDARKGLQMFNKVNVPVLGVIENMSYFTPPDLPDRKYHIFGKGGGRRIAAELGVDFLGEVPIDPRVVEGGDAGRPIVVHAPESEAAEAFRRLAVFVSTPHFRISTFEIAREPVGIEEWRLQAAFRRSRSQRRKTFRRANKITDQLLVIIQ